MTQTPSTVKTILIHNKEYVPVSERVRLLHEAGREFEMLESEPRQYGEKWIWRCVVRIDNKQYIGSAEIKLNARPGSADATDAWACGETSALGRCLAFAGIGMLESIASADEVVQAQRQAEPPRDAARSNGNGKPAQMPDTRARLTTLYNAGLEKHLYADRDEFAVWCSSVLVSERVLSPPDLLSLSHDDLAKIGAFLASEPARTGGAEAA